jgi:hypothetical protein
MVVELQYDQPFRRLAGPSSDQQVEVRSDLFFEGVRREVLYDRGRDYEVMNPQFEGGLVMICKRYGLHNYRLGQRRLERLDIRRNFKRDVAVIEREGLFRCVKAKGPRLCH